MRIKPLPVYLDDVEREIVEKRSKQWGCTLSSAIKRMIRESVKQGVVK